MGNQQSAVPRERNKSGSQDLLPGSPHRGKRCRSSIEIALKRNFFSINF